MLDIINKAIIGIFMIVQTVSSTVGINHLSKPTPTPVPNPNLELIISSPEPSSTPTPTSRPVPTTNNEQNVNTTPVSGDGSRTGNIVSYKEYCTGKQISVYENEIINKVSSFDGKTYGMTKGDWDCYDKNSQTQKQLANTQNNYPPCTVYYPGLKESKTYNYTSPEQCSYWQERAATPPQPLTLPEIKAAPLPTIEPYKFSQEFLDALERSREYNSTPWKPTQFNPPTPEPQVYGGCFGRSKSGWINCE